MSVKTAASKLIACFATLKAKSLLQDRDKPGERPGSAATSQGGLTAGQSTVSTGVEGLLAQVNQSPKRFI